MGGAMQAGQSDKETWARSVIKGMNQSSGKTERGGEREKKVCCFRFTKLELWEDMVVEKRDRPRVRTRRRTERKDQHHEENILLIMLSSPNHKHNHVDSDRDRPSSGKHLRDITQEICLTKSSKWAPRHIIKKGKSDVSSCSV